VVVANSASRGECPYCRESRENLCTSLEYLNGAFAERILVPRRFAERSTHRMPDELAFELAALAEPLACVLHGIEACSLRPRADVAVYGAGPIGLLFAGALSAEGHRVTVADPNPSRLDASPLVTHRLPLSAFDEGLALVRERKALKVLFTPAVGGAP
jgi:L-iditol 2-dehydrogenase